MEIGFERVGFTGLSAPKVAPHLGEWLAAGHHGEMDYLSREPDKRADAELAHPWAKTMICLTRSYFTEPPPAGKGQGRFALYALGLDYHDVLKRDLKVLSRFIEETFSERCRMAVDTSAILERPYGEKSGLGWVGKNTLLLAPQEGSYFFLAELVTSLPLDHDEPFEKNHCGTCSRCLEICPTNAFPEPYVLDSRRCISYLTIEYRGVIPRKLRPLIGRWVFGCDLCQEVCPWNKFARLTRAPEFRPSQDLSTHQLVDFMGMTKESFRARFRKTPIWRAHRDGFLRNVAVALGNSEDKDAIPALVSGLSDPSELVRIHAAWGLGRFPLNENARIGLQERLKIEEMPEVKEELLLALFPPSAP